MPKLLNCPTISKNRTSYIFKLGRILVTGLVPDKLNYEIGIISWFLMSFLYFLEKYEYVGRLLKPGEEPASYSDEEDENQQDSNTSNKSSNAGDKPKDE